MSDRITLRQATLDDLGMLFSWRNDPDTRRASRNTGDVSRHEHETWLKATLKNPDRRLYIAEEDGHAVGTIRADRAGGFYELSWTVAPEARGRGVGERMVRALAGRIEQPIEAWIKPWNTASIRIAEGAGMTRERMEDGMLLYRRGSVPATPGRDGE